MKRWSLLVWAFVLGSITVSRLQAQNPAYLLDALGVGSDGPNSFVDRTAGDDMLPYTDDDLDTDEGANPAGILSFGHMDNNNNGVIDEGEPSFVMAAEGPDRAIAADTFLYSVYSHPEYGVIYEAEDWVAYFEANSNGPSGEGPAESGDFEINDNNGWTEESNAYVYNNLGNNQHGLGLAKYAIDYRHPSNPQEGADWVYDEIEGWTKTFCFVGVMDDPDTPFNERGACRRWYRNREGLEVRGYMIPADDLPDLADGSLPSPFGWESEDRVALGREPIDLATYMRETIATVLDDEDLNIANEVGVPVDAQLPATHVMLLQWTEPMAVNNSDGECGNTDFVDCETEADPALCQVQQYAAFWGIPEDGSGVWRSSALLGFNDELSLLFFGDAVHLWAQEPDDGVPRNLWIQDYFVREDVEHLGNYTIASGDDLNWDIIPEPQGGIVEGPETFDKVLVTLDSDAVTAPVPRPLTMAEAPIEAVVDLSEDISVIVPPAQGAGGGVPEDISYQIILHNGETVVAYADLSREGSQVHLGGTYDAIEGVASGPDTSGDPGQAADIGEIDSAAILSLYSRYILELTANGASLREAAEWPENETSSFVDLSDVGDELASVEGAVDVDSTVANLTISVTGRGAINTIALFASPGVGPFQRGDCQQNGTMELTDGVFLLNFLFLGGDAPDCTAACDFSGGGSLDISTAVFAFNFLFLGGGRPPAPFPMPGYSQLSSDAALGCVSYNP